MQIRPHTHTHTHSYKRVLIELIKGHSANVNSRNVHKSVSFLWMVVTVRTKKKRTKIVRSQAKRPLLWASKNSFSQQTN